jgi:BASS family bile acid:Na+ symporter
MIRFFNLFRNRNFLLISGIILGLSLGEGAHYMEHLIIPVLALLMTLATMEVPGSIFLSPRSLWRSSLAGLVMNYGVLGGFILALNMLLIQDQALWVGFVILMAVPPAVAVIPFTYLLNGNSAFSLIATVGCYLGALIIMPLLTLGLLGADLVDGGKLLTIVIELVLLPLIFSQALRKMGWAHRIDPLRGAITNWSFFLVTYTIVGLNQVVFLHRPLTLAPVAIIALGSTFFLGWVIQRLGSFFRIDPQTLTSMTLLGTCKNTGLGAGLALTLFSEKTAVPSTVTTIFMISYFVWLSLQQRRKSAPFPEV